jgi:phosphopantothenoylcysteine decarboxylase / phosphopantothenate---cysteine ligase
MTMLKGKKILLGVTGSIAAYKAAFLVRLLVKAGAEVQVLMTPSAQSFITPLTLATLSRRSVFSDLSSEASWNNHVEIGLWADAMVIAPLTAATLSKLANGMCDNIVVAAYLSARCPVFFAPAMDLDMWAHPATQENVRRLEAYGNHLIPVEEGELASGLSGPGRMAEPEAIVQYLDEFWHRAASLRGRRVLITAGPTHEPIDPVRFIGNRSSGKMGLALAAAAARRGAAVTLILGPTHLEVPPGLDTIRVQTATEMHQAAQRHFPAADIAILAAAVADYRPGQASEHKIKKQQGQALALVLQENPDIAAALGQAKQPRQILVGFALETQDEEANARAKLEKKNFDCIVINSLQDEQAGFYHDTNKISILYPNNKMRKFELKPKSAVAEDILDAAEALLSESKSIAEL